MGGNHRISFGANYRIYRKGIHFSCVYLHGVMLLLSVIISLHFWFRDLIREFYKKYEVLLMVLFLFSHSPFLPIPFIVVADVYVCKSKNSVSWVSQSMILSIVVSSLCLRDYISFILSLVFSF